MALSDNPLLKTVVGQLGKTTVIRRYANRTVVSKYPDMSNVKPSEKHLVEKHHFADAVRYSKAIIDDPERKLRCRRHFLPEN